MKLVRWSLCILAFLLLPACSSVPSEGDTGEGMAWQDYYDLGIRYLSEGNYQEAIIAFTAAIDIDPKRPEAYIGRGDTYHTLAKSMGLDEKAREEGLGHAVDDYEKAIKLDGTNPEIYQKLAEVYIALNDRESALAVLEEGYAETGDSALKEFLEKMRAEEELSQVNLNAYGGTEFTERFEYRDFSELTLSEQNFIEAISTAVLSEDLETIQGLLGFQFDEYNHRAYWTGYTIWSGYKLHIYTSETETLDDGDNHSSLWFEIRPENGTGYFINISHFEPVASLNKESWSDSVFTELKSCPCSDWQWNGHFVQVVQNRFYQTWNNGHTCKTEDIYKTEGEMQNSLRTGTFTTEIHTSEVWSRRPDLNSESADSYTSIYQDGYLVEERGRPIENPGPTKMDGTCGGTLDEQWVRDYFYW